MKRLLAIVVLLSFVVLFSSVVVINTMHTEHMGHGCQSGRDVRNTSTGTQEAGTSCSVCAVLKQAEQLFRAVAIAFIVTAIIFFTVTVVRYDSHRDYSVSLVGCKVRMNT